MKKLIVFSLVFALIAGVAFAQISGSNKISIEAWGRGFIVPLAIETAPQANGKTVSGTEDTVYAGSGIGWYHPNAPRVDFRIHGDGDAAGFRAQLSADGGAASIEDDAYIYVKPFSNNYLRLLVGRYIDATLGGGSTPLGAFNNCVLSGGAGGLGQAIVGSFGDDTIFTRFRGGNESPSMWTSTNSGFLLTSAPMDGLYIGIAVNGKYVSTEAEEAYRNMHIAVGYTIPGIGLFRVGYRGGFAGEEGTGKDDPAFDKGKPAVIEAAFKLMAVEGLNLDLGFRTFLPLKFASKAETCMGSEVNLTGSFAVNDMISLGLCVGTSFGAYERANDKDETASGFKMRIDFAPTFVLDFGTVTLGVTYAMVGDSTKANGDNGEDSQNQVGFGVWVGKGVGGGNIKAGITYTLAPTDRDGKANGSGVFMIPIVMEYAFF